MAYSQAITDKYHVTGLAATKVILGVKFGRVALDLTRDSNLKLIDSFVMKYPDQPFFKLKGEVSADVKYQRNRRPQRHPES